MKKWLPFRLVKQGRMFKYHRVTFLKIQPVTTIGKTPYNLCYCKTGELGYLDPETAVQI